MYYSPASLSFQRKLAPYDGLLSCLQSHGNAKQFSSAVLVLMLYSSICLAIGKKHNQKLSVLSIMKEPKLMFDQVYKTLFGDAPAGKKCLPRFYSTSSLRILCFIGAIGSCIQNGCTRTCIVCIMSKFQCSPIFFQF